MIPIARPLASDATEKAIAKLIESHIEKGTLTTGIKACQKHILGETKGLLVLTADTTPMDLISHFPVLCEDRDISYIFLRSKDSMPNRFTCVFLEMDEDDVQKVLETQNE